MNYQHHMNWHQMDERQMFNESTSNFKRDKKQVGKECYLYGTL